MKNTREFRRIREFRFNDERRISGIAIRYNVPSVVYGIPEEFAPGAFLGDMDDVKLNVMHNRERILTRTGSGLKLVDSEEALSFVADLPSTREADDAIELVRSGVFRGASLEFVSLREEYSDDKRRITEAKLYGIGIVDDPAHKSAVLEARMKQLRRSRDLAYCRPFLFV